MKALLLLLVGLIPFWATAADKVSCSGNWKVTGYFTPLEIDYPRTSTRQIKIRKHGYHRFSTSFLKAVRMEGWGRTNAGWYLGYYSRNWHKSSHPLNAMGTALRWGAIATDQRVLGKGSRVVIPTLPASVKKQVFRANDVGSAINGKHVDIYTGEGRKAEDLTYQLTGTGHLVCRFLPR